MSLDLGDIDQRIDDLTDEIAENAGHLNTALRAGDADAIGYYRNRETLLRNEKLEYVKQRTAVVGMLRERGSTPNGPSAVAIPAPSAPTANVVTASPSRPMTAAAAAAAAAASPIKHRHVWTLIDFARQPRKKIVGDSFFFLNHRWQPFVFPGGNGVRDFLSVYLDCVSLQDTELLIPVKFKVTVTNFYSADRSISMSASHVFRASERDRGFQRLIARSALLDPLSGFCKDGAVQIMFEIEPGDLPKVPPLDG